MASPANGSVHTGWITLKTRGFTLLELVLVISLLAVMAGLSVPVIRYLQKQQEEIRAQAEAVETQRATLSWLRAVVSLAQPKGMAVDTASGREVLWRGSSDDMEWVGTVPQDMREPRVVQQKLWLTPDAQGWQLHYAYRPLGESGDYPTENTLLLQVKQAVFQYRRFETRGRVSEWLASWADSTQMPVQVRMQFTPIGQSTAIDWVVALPMSSGLNPPSLAFGSNP